MRNNKQEPCGNSPCGSLILFCHFVVDVLCTKPMLIQNFKILHCHFAVGTMS